MHRHERIVRQNEKLAAAARTHHFDDAPVPFLCECGDGVCQEFVSLTLDAYGRRRVEGIRVLAAAHDRRCPPGACEDADAGWARAVTDR